MGQAGVAARRSESLALYPAEGYNTAVLTWGAAAIRRGGGGGELSGVRVKGRSYRRDYVER